MHHTDDMTIIFGHSAQHIPVQFFIMKEDLYLLIEENCMKGDEFANFISAIEKLPSTNEKNIALHQGNEFIDLYKTLFDKHYGKCIKECLPLSIADTP